MQALNTPAYFVDHDAALAYVAVYGGGLQVQGFLPWVVLNNQLRYRVWRHDEWLQRSLQHMTKVVLQRTNAVVANPATPLHQRLLQNRTHIHMRQLSRELVCPVTSTA